MAAALLTLAACTSDAPGGNAGGAATTAAEDRCHTSQLTAALGAGEPGTGQRYVTVRLTNTSAQTCRVFGYGGLQLLDAARLPLPTDVVRDATEAPITIDVAPGSSVTQQVHFSAVPGPGDAPTGECQPSPTFAEVTPPDETDFLVADWTFGPVCEQGHLDQQAYHG